jgi:aryl sulfotransferase
VISTRSKSGTTWMQMICALLVFQTVDLPAPVAELSPWLDWLVTPRAAVYDRLARQAHRRFIKTHTPLDGLPFDARVTYIVVGRHPLDMAVSLYYQGLNLDRARMSELVGSHAPAVPPRPRPPLRDWLLSWIDDDADPHEALDSLCGVLWHYGGAWDRRHQPQVVLVHYDDLSGDLEGEMRRLADLLGSEVKEEVWGAFVRAATFEQMRTRPERVAPGTAGILKDPTAFFRRGSSGAGSEALTADEVSHYQARVAELAPPGLVRWLHSGALHGQSPAGLA